MSKVLEGYASVFNVEDRQRDVIVKGAFSKTLKKGKLPLLWQHRAEEPIGTCIELKEDEYGLYVKAIVLNKVNKAEEAIALLENASIEGLSIGFIVKESYKERSSKVRVIKDLDLYEVSLVTFPANVKAKVLRCTDKE